MKKRNLFAALLCAGICTSSMAAWQVDNSASSLNIISVKNAAVTEVHKLTRLEGAVMDSGEFHLSVDLTSIETGIEIRNNRMQEMLFNVAEFPRATINAKFDPALVSKLKCGETTQTEVKFDLNLHGQVKALTATVQITALENGALHVNSIQPLLVNAADFNLAEGIEALRNIAGLKSIAAVVPVSFNLALTKQ